MKNKKEDENKMPRLGILVKWKLKKQIKALEKCIKLERNIIEKLGNNIENLNEDEKEVLLGLKEQMIEAIMGNKKKETLGLKDIFEISDDKTGKEITEEDLQKERLDDLTNLLEDLINSLKQEI